MGERDRRQVVRLQTKLVTFVKRLATGKVKRVLTKDIGGIGICIVSDERYEPETVLEVELKLPDNTQPITFKGVVVWSRVVEEPKQSYKPLVAEAGIKFTEIDAKQRALIMQYAVLNAMPRGEA
jgi:hypothetical protein